MFDLEKTETAVFNLYALFYAMRDSAEILDEDSLPKHREIIIAFEKIADEQLRVIQENISNVENKTYSTAEMISFLITDKSVPNNISNALGDAISDLSTEKSNDSPEYIARVLESVKDE